MTTATKTVLDHWRPSVPDEVEMCYDWLMARDPDEYVERSSYSLKHEITNDDGERVHVRHGSMIEALFEAGWPVREEGYYLIIDC